MVPVAALITFALPVAAATAQPPGLPRTYTAKTIESPAPRAGGSFGWGIASADLTGDGKLDLLVAQSQDATSSQVFLFDGVTGALVDTIKPPELNPDANPDPALAFVYVETMPDIGSCPGGDGPDADKICDAATVGPPDGIPEIIVGARGLRVNVANPATPPTTSDPALGRGYIIDGKTRAVLKRIDMPLVDRQRQAALAAAPQFGRVMASPQSMPPCAGSAAEDNNSGVGPCPDTPLASRIGDLNGDFIPDIVVTARNFVETSADTGPDAAAATSQCQAATVDPTPPVKCTSGKAWAYSGAIVGTDPKAIEDTALYAMKNPLTQVAGGGEFGGNMYRIGDVNTDVSTTDCNATPAAASCAPEFVIPARNLSYPFAAPSAEFNSVGAAFLFNGRTGAPIVTPGASAAQPAITSPEPQKFSQFSGSFNGGRPVGDLGASTAPDILLPAALQNGMNTDEGRMWAFDAVSGGGGATGSWQFATLNDPDPVVGGTFGGAFTGVGDIVRTPDEPTNEVLVGGFHFDPFTEVSGNVVGDVHFMNVQSGDNLMTIANPSGARGDGFGVGLIPMGDLNGDGFIDFAASAYLADGKEAAQGRAWIFTSDNSPLPAPPPPPLPPPPPPVMPLALPTPLLPGTCSNQLLGTDVGETLKGTLAGDKIFGLGGNDTIYGYEGNDCVDGGDGNDSFFGGDGNDQLVGGLGGDIIQGGDGRDQIFGGARNDRLYGGYGRDVVAGGSGDDLIVGGPDDDRLFGESGKDRLVGGDGRNYIDGGDSNDSIDSHNGEVDRVICGAGRGDRVYADRMDRLNGCEIVTFTKPKPKPKPKAKK